MTFIYISKPLSQDDCLRNTSSLSLWNRSSEVFHLCLLSLFSQDIAILTTDVTRCPYYQAESENVKSRYACILPDGYLASRSNANIRRSFVIPITKEGCEVRTSVKQIAIFSSSFT